MASENKEAQEHMKATVFNVGQACSRSYSGYIPFDQPKKTGIEILITIKNLQYITLLTKQLENFPMF